MVPRPAESAGDKAVYLDYYNSALNFHNAREPFIHVSKRWDGYQVYDERQIEMREWPRSWRKRITLRHGLTPA